MLPPVELTETSTLTWWLLGDESSNVSSASEHSTPRTNLHRPRRYWRHESIYHYILLRELIIFQAIGGKKPFNTDLG